MPHPPIPASAVTAARKARHVHQEYLAGNITQATCVALLKRVCDAESFTTETLSRVLSVQTGYVRDLLRGACTISDAEGVQLRRLAETEPARGSMPPDHPFRLAALEFSALVEQLLQRGEEPRHIVELSGKPWGTIRAMLARHGRFRKDGKPYSLPPSRTGYIGRTVSPGSPDLS